MKRNKEIFLEDYEKQAQLESLFIEQDREEEYEILKKYCKFSKKFEKRLFKRKFKPTFANEIQDKLVF